MLALSTWSFESKFFIVLQVKTIKVDVVRSTEEDAAEEGEKRSVLKIGVDNSTEESPINNFDAERHLNRKILL